MTNVLQYTQTTRTDSRKRSYARQLAYKLNVASDHQSGIDWNPMIRYLTERGESLEIINAKLADNEVLRDSGGRITANGFAIMTALYQRSGKVHEKRVIVVYPESNKQTSKRGATYWGWEDRIVLAQYGNKYIPAKVVPWQEHHNPEFTTLLYHATSSGNERYPTRTMVLDFEAFNQGHISPEESHMANVFSTHIIREYVEPARTYSPDDTPAEGDYSQPSLPDFDKIKSEPQPESSQIDTSVKASTPPDDTTAPQTQPSPPNLSESHENPADDEKSSDTVQSTVLAAHIAKMTDEELAAYGLSRTS